MATFHWRPRPTRLRRHGVGRRRLECAASEMPRPRIEADTRLFVWQRDGGRCCECGSVKDLQFDHIVPVAMGGSNTAQNVELLCADCNRRKSARLVVPPGPR
jgi:5-methylcytosine-specific restriction endonuclease McrA